MTDVFTPEVPPQSVRIPGVASEAENQGISNQQMHEDAFYATALSGTNDVIQTFDDIIDEYNTNGYSQLVENLRNQFSESKQMLNSTVMEQIIADNELTRDEKLTALRKFKYIGEEKQDLKLNYLQSLIAAKEEDDPTGVELYKGQLTIDDVRKDTIAHDLANAFSKNILGEPMYVSQAMLDEEYRKLNELQDGAPWYEVFDYKVVKPVSAEVLSAVKTFVVAALPYIAEIAGTLALAPTDKYTMTTAREKAREFINEYGGEFLMETFDEMSESLFGINSELLDNTFVTKLMKNVDDGLSYLANKVNPDNPEAVKVPMEIVLAVLIARNKKLPNDLRAIKAKGKLAYYKRTDPNYYELLRKEGYKQKINGYNVKRLFAQDKPSSVQIIRNSRSDLPDNHPLSITRKADAKQAEAIVETILTDSTGKAIQSLNITPGQLIYFTLMPKFFQNKLYSDPLNGTATMKKLIKEQAAALEEYAVNKFFKDMPERKAYIQELAESLNKLSDGIEITANPAEFAGRFSGKEIETNLVFNKTATENFKSFEEAIDAIQILERKVREINEGKTTDVGEFFIENIGQKGDVVGLYTLRDLRELAVSPDSAKISPNFRLKWHKKQEFVDGMEAIANGLGRMDWKNQNFLYRALFAKGKVYNWFAKFGKLSRETDLTLTLASMRSEGFMRRQVEILDKYIEGQDNKFRGQLDTLYKAQQGKTDLMSIGEIYNTLDTNLTKKRVETLQEALRLTRQIERFNYMTLNHFEINRYNSAGYKNYLDLTDQAGEMSRIMVKEDFDFSIIPGIRPSKVWDMRENQAVDYGSLTFSKEAIPGKHMLMENELPTRQVVRLSKPFYDAEGTGYNYAILSKSDKLTGNPDWIIPTLTGHMPRISEGSFFVRAYPYKVTMDGNTSIADFNNVLKIHAANGRAVQHFRTKTEADKFIKKYISEDALLPEYDSKKFRFEIEKAKELDSKDNVEANYIREASLNAARSRTGLPFNPDLYAEPYTSLVRTSVSNGSRIYQQALLESFKEAYVKAYKDLVDLGDNTKGKIGDEIVDAIPLGEQADTAVGFPINREQIKQRGGQSDIFEQALADYDAITKYDAGLPSNYFARAIGYVSDLIGEIADVDNPVAQLISRGARKAERNANTITNAPLRVLSTLNIILSPFWRQIPLQSMNVYGPLLVADPKLFHTSMYNVGMTIYARSLRLPYMQKYAKYSEDVAKYYLENESAHKKAGIDSKEVLSLKDHQLIVEEMERSGLGRVSEHVLAKGVFTSIPNNLTSQSALSRYASKVTKAFSKAGLEAGEYGHRVGMFHAARLQWMNNNPGKNWRTREALNQITYDAHQLSGSMTKQNTFAFQNMSITQYLGQFMSYSAAVAETMWNPAASPFTPKQRAALLAFNVAAFGTKYGIPLGMGAVILDMLRNNGANDLADALDNEGLFNFTINGMSDWILPTYDESGKQIKSTADAAKVFAPFGNEKFGPYGTFYKTLVQLTGLQEVSDYNAGPVASGFKQMGQTYDMFKAMYTTKGFTWNERTEASLELLARFTAAGRAYYNWKMYTELNDKVNKQGQLTGTRFSRGDQFLTLFSVPNKTTDDAFKAFDLNKSIEQRSKELAKNFYQSMEVIKQNKFSFTELMDIIQMNNSMLLDDLGDAGLEMFHDEIITLDQRRYRTRGESLLQILYDQGKGAGKRKYTEEQIQLIKKGTESMVNAMPGLQDDVDFLIDQVRQQKEEK